MPTANVRYGRPKGTGLNDSQQLRAIAALLAANPKLKPTTAIRSLGIDSPSDIRRLRDKFRAEQSKLMADARQAARVNGAHVSPPVTDSAKTDCSASAPRREEPPTTSKSRSAQASADPPASLLASWYEVGWMSLCITAESQAILAQHWLTHPAVAAAIRGQLAASSFVIAVANRKKYRPHVLK